MVETHSDEAPIVSYEVLASRCWKCGEDLAHDVAQHTWQCRCGFDVDDGFLREFLLTVDQVAFVGGLGLAKHKHSKFYALIDLNGRKRPPA